VQALLIEFKQKMSVERRTDKKTGKVKVAHVKKEQDLQKMPVLVRKVVCDRDIKLRSADSFLISTFDGGAHLLLLYTARVTAASNRLLTFAFI
jgi:hypothetical protein